MKVAIISGASSGLGAEFARQIASLPLEKSVDEIWLIARRAERLQELADALPLPCRVFSLDLCESTSFLEIQETLSACQAQVVYLVNAAGYGTQGQFCKIEDLKLGACLDLNIDALLRLTYVVKPYLIKGSHVLQISSVSAFLPQPNYATYAASKTFVLYFSRALHREWEEEGINVIAVCPNLMDTEFIRLAEMPEDTLRVKKLGLENKDKVVRQALKDSFRGKDVSVSSWAGKLLRLGAKILPKSFILYIEKKLGMY